MSSTEISEVGHRLLHGLEDATINQVYESYPADYNNHILQLPVIRLCYGAEAAVAVFFVLSGYTLSRQPIAAISSGDLGKANVVLSSLVLRGGLRLFGPAVMASLLAYLAQRAGWMPDKGLPSGYVRDIWNDSKLYLAYLGTLFDIWTWEIDLAVGEWWFNPHLWTVPVEFRCSMVVFLLTTGTQRCTAGVRLAAEVVLITQSMWVWRWDVLAFAAGTLVAELEHQRPKILQSSDLPMYLVSSRWNQELTKHLWHGLVLRMLLWSVFILGMYLASYPYIPPKEGIFFSKLAWMVNYKVEGRRIFHVIAGTLILLAIVHEPFLQIPFQTAFPRYLGRISYAFYLLHGLLIRVVGSRILHRSWKITGTEGRQLDAGFLLGFTLLIPLVVWTADLFERAIDRPCILCAKRLETYSNYLE
ncbi:MAG: hypothetical protein L6R37_006092 [Teloschistes peruensis]|nr:MAG: hypothetical protein L6R37_006092 [Teloschistes peruensis]